MFYFFFFHANFRLVRLIYANGRIGWGTKLLEITKILFRKKKKFVILQGSVMELMGCNEDEGPYTLFYSHIYATCLVANYDSRFHSLKYQWSTTLSCRNVGIRKLYFYQINHFCLEFNDTTFVHHYYS